MSMKHTRQYVQRALAPLDRLEVTTQLRRSAQGTPAPEIVFGEIVDSTTTQTGYIPFKAHTELPLSEHTVPFILIERADSEPTWTADALARINAEQLVTPTDRALFAPQLARGSQAVMEGVRTSPSTNLRRWKLLIAAMLVVETALAAALVIGLSGTQLF